MEFAFYAGDAFIVMRKPILHGCQKAMYAMYNQFACQAFSGDENVGMNGIGVVRCCGKFVMALPVKQVLANYVSFNVSA
jgi:hypothetical protein